MAMAGGLFALAPSTQSQVRKIVSDDTQPRAPTVQTIVYQQLIGRVLGEFDSSDPPDAIIQDIELE
jgi:hypothetical protein